MQVCQGTDSRVAANQTDQPQYEAPGQAYQGQMEKRSVSLSFTACQGGGQPAGQGITPTLWLM